MLEASILVIDNDAASQRALKSTLDAEGWRVRIVPGAAQALAALATGNWNLAIVNVAAVDLAGPLFAILRELAHSGEEALQEEGGAPRNRIRVLFLVPALMADQVQPLLEREVLPYSLKPYHLHDFLEKVSELLAEAGAIAAPIRGIGGFAAANDRSFRRPARDTRRRAMFASRAEYQMSEEEMTEYEHQEEQERLKREKERKDRERL